MTGAATKALRPADAHTAEGLLRQLATLWKAPVLSAIPVVVHPRLSRTLGRLVGHPWRIDEGAHAALAVKAGPTRPAPHGPEWRRLMALAGYPQAAGAHWRCHRGTGESPQRKEKQQPTRRTQPPTAYDQWCPVCQSSRQARRPVKAWRCAACTACTAAGLDGTLEITRRTRRPTTTP